MGQSSHDVDATETLSNLLSGHRTKMAPPVPCARMWPSRHTYIKCNVHPRVDIRGYNKISTLELYSPSENSPRIIAMMNAGQDKARV